MRFLKPDPWYIFLLLIGSLFLLTNLGNGRLWQDEAETALLGRHTLQFGYPKAFDGTHYVNPALPVRAGYAWTYHPWLPMYLAATSFSLFGEGTVSARFPFALFGLGALGLSYWMIKRIFGNVFLARVATLFLVTSVPFLLHMRQCRYYAPTLFFSLWTAWAYWRSLREQRWAGLELMAALVLLFHTDHGVFAATLAALGLHFALSRPLASQRNQGLAFLVALGFLTVPWIIYLQSGQHHRAFSGLEIRHHLEFYFRQVNRFVVPIVFWTLLLAFTKTSPRAFFGDSDPAIHRALSLVGCLLGVGFLFLIFIPEQRHFRYLIFLLPWVYLLQAKGVAYLFQRRRVLGITLTALLVLTDLFHYSGPSILAAQIPAVKKRLSHPEVPVRSFLIDFLGELTHPYRGPIDGVVEFLKTNGKPGQVVKTPYEEMPIIFYTGLSVEPIRRPEQFTHPTYPDWIVIRRDWISPDFFNSPYHQEIQRRYRPILLDAPDIPWQNRPDPGYHRFRSDPKALPVLVYQRK